MTYDNTNRMVPLAWLLLGAAKPEVEITIALAGDSFLVKRSDREVWDSWQCFDPGIGEDFHV